MLALNERGRVALSAIILEDTTMLSQTELDWMAKNASAVDSEAMQHAESMSVYERGEARAICVGGICTEITGVPEPTGVGWDAYRDQPQVGWKAGWLREIGFTRVS